MFTVRPSLAGAVGRGVGTIPSTTRILGVGRGVGHGVDPVGAMDPAGVGDRAGVTDPAGDRHTPIARHRPALRCLTDRPPEPVCRQVAIPRVVTPRLQAHHAPATWDVQAA